MQRRGQDTSDDLWGTEGRRSKGMDRLKSIGEDVVTINGGLKVTGETSELATVNLFGKRTVRLGSDDIVVTNDKGGSGGRGVSHSSHTLTRCHHPHASSGALDFFKCTRSKRELQALQLVPWQIE